MAEIVGGMTGALQGTVSGVINKGQSLLDRFFPPEKRNELWAKLSKFATEKPMLASFILSQIALTGVPLGLFVIMTITVIVFSLLAALLIGLLGALIFTVVAVGFALLILLPTLFITTFAAAFIWLWGVGGYYIIKWFNKKEVPGIHTPMKGALGENGALDALTGDGKAEQKAEEKDEQKADENGAPKEAHKKPKENGTPKTDAKENKGVNGVVKKSPAGDVGKAAGVDLKDPKKAADVGKVAGKTGDLKKATDVTGGIL